MMMNINDISDADRELFRQSVGDVKKSKIDRVHLRQRRRTQSPAAGRSIDTKDSNTAMTAAIRPEKNPGSNDRLFFKRTGIQNKVLEKLRRGKLTIDRELDLHGLTSKEARTELVRFLDHCRQNHIRCVRIIHGKGHGSGNGIPVIKTSLKHWLQQIPQVLAVTPARPSDGGSGAVYVLLKTAG